MSGIEIALATPADRELITSSLVAAFVDDPVLRWLFPDEETYREYAAAFFGHLFDKRVHRQSIWMVDDGASVAIWEPPAADSAPPGDTLAALLPADAMARVGEYDEAVHAAMPAGPSWYLGVLGTHPEHVGKGWGRAVMAAGLRRAAQDGLPAVLETATPANVGFYQRAGWEVVGELTDPVPTWIMRQVPVIA
jgi:ribosomal protein S18 acetylase RimI-like enzyme